MFRFHFLILHFVCKKSRVYFHFTQVGSEWGRGSGHAFTLTPKSQYTHPVAIPKLLVPNRLQSTDEVRVSIIYHPMFLLDVDHWPCLIPFISLLACMTMLGLSFQVLQSKMGSTSHSCGVAAQLPFKWWVMTTNSGESIDIQWHKCILIHHSSHYTPIILSTSPDVQIEVNVWQKLWRQLFMDPGPGM